MPQELCTLLKNARNKKGLSTRKAAQLLGISKTRLGHYETCPDVRPPLARLKEIAAVYDVEYSLLLAACEREDDVILEKLQGTGPFGSLVRKLSRLPDDRLTKLELTAHSLGVFTLPPK